MNWNEIEFAPIPAGTYEVGSDPRTADALVKLFILNERVPTIPARTVSLQPFHISVFPVTNKQYEKVIPFHRRSKYTPDDEHPVVDVTFHEVLRFCAATGTYLPTEEQWEAAARGRENHPSSNSPYPSRKSCNTFPSPGPNLRGTHEANSFGLFDMAGNVNELTNTKINLDNGDFVVVTKGGGWGACRQSAYVGFRTYIDPMVRSNRVGFRVCVKD
jgi:formylglycine-generating enzyme required for sulfatase activity